MPISHYFDLDAWKLADAFKLHVFTLVKQSSGARQNLKFREQLIESARGPAKHITEGFLRKSPAMLLKYLDYAISSLGEAADHVRDGIQLGFFTADSCAEAFVLARRCRGACLGLKRSQERYLREQDREKQLHRKSSAGAAARRRQR